MNEPTDAEVEKIGRELKWLHETNGMRWCLIVKMLKRPEPELRRILCLYNDRLAKRKDPEGR